MIAKLISRLVWIESGTVCLLILLHAFGLDLIEKIAEPASPLLAVIGLLALGALGLKPPLHSRPGAKLLYVLAELTLVALASAFGVTRTFFVVYMIVIAKAAVLLERKDLIWSIVYAIVMFVCAKELNFWLVEKAVFSLSPFEHVVHVLILGRVINFALAITLSAVCAVAFLLEYESRMARQKLNDQVQELATRAERTRIAREIHDHVGHTLTSLKMQIEIARRAATKNPEKYKQSMETALALAGRARRDLQAAIAGAPDFSVNLTDAITSLLDEYASQGTFEIELILMPELDTLPGSAKHQMFSAVKESLNNINKYSQATKIAVEAVQKDNLLTIAVRDNGKGFNATEVKDTSYGLQGMRERLALIGGAIDVVSMPEAGTTVTISVPIPDVAAEVAR